MKIIVLTSPSDLPDEQGMLHEMALAGIWKIHLRKPDFNKDLLRTWLDRSSPELRNKLVIHKHRDLATEYNLDGVHHASGYHGNPDESASISTHGTDEINAKPGFRYYFLSPLFPSISKPGYAPDKEFVLSGRTECIIGLGGIDASKIPDLPTGLSGIAILGAIWNAPDPLKALMEIKKAVI